MTSKSKEIGRCGKKLTSCAFLECKVVDDGLVTMSQATEVKGGKTSILFFSMLSNGILMSDLSNCIISELVERCSVPFAPFVIVLFRKTQMHDHFVISHCFSFPFLVRNVSTHSRWAGRKTTTHSSRGVIRLSIQPSLGRVDLAVECLYLFSLGHSHFPPPPPSIVCIS